MSGCRPGGEDGSGFLRGGLLGSIEVNQRPLPPKAELGWWYLFYFSTERGRLGYRQYPTISTN